MSDVNTLYNEDFVAWSKEQATALRSAARGGSNQKLDWENLAEEIDDLGKSLRRELRSYMTRIVQHLAKLEYSPAFEPRNPWRRSIRLSRIRAHRVLEDNSSLKRDVRRLARQASEDGIELAIAELDEHHETDDLDLTAMRGTAFTPEQILGDWFPPEPPRD
ncbi:MAG TPA: DUF29 domain-containing protein [Stellaceae bacterium]|jgi:hypothetical protein|nr:DUF29 domain-containing protein [Stellaceae bacterium]